METRFSSKALKLQKTSSNSLAYGYSYACYKKKMQKGGYSMEIQWNNEIFNLEERRIYHDVGDNNLDSMSVLCVPSVLLGSVQSQIQEYCALDRAACSDKQLRLYATDTIMALIKAVLTTHTFKPQNYAMFEGGKTKHVLKFTAKIGSTKHVSKTIVVVFPDLKLDEMEDGAYDQESDSISSAE